MEKESYDWNNITILTSVDIVRSVHSDILNSCCSKVEEAPALEERYPIGGQYLLIKS